MDPDNKKFGRGNIFNFLCFMHIIIASGVTFQI